MARGLRELMWAKVSEIARKISRKGKEGGRGREYGYRQAACIKAWTCI